MIQLAVRASRVGGGHAFSGMQGQADRLLASRTLPQTYVDGAPFWFDENLVTADYKNHKIINEHLLDKSKLQRS